jgi:hypothetical protein
VFRFPAFAGIKFVEGVAQAVRQVCAGLLLTTLLSGMVEQPIGGSTPSLRSGAARTAGSTKRSIGRSEHARGGRG